MMVALLGTIVLTVTSAIEPGTGGRSAAPRRPVPPKRRRSSAARSLSCLACLAAAFVALVLIEERPLRTGNCGGAESIAVIPLRHGTLDLRQSTGNTEPEPIILELNCHGRPRTS